MKKNEEPRNGREVGTILRWDDYEGSLGIEPMIEVLWNTGKVGFILSERVEVILDNAKNEIDFMAMSLVD
tara:strand:- start:2236 stop:2445 length:210 start_codon:yes stop_codon:yes gene_type:complete